MSTARDALARASEQHPNARVALTAAIENDSASHAYLFHGPRGVGKREVARAFAACLLESGAAASGNTAERALRGSHPDLTWVKPSGAHEMRIDDINEPIIRAATRTPMEGGRRIFVIEDVHTMHPSAANRMLKTLEEPAAYAHFLLLTSAPDQVMPTIISRCQGVRFDALAAAAIAEQLVEDGVESARAASCAALSGGDLVLARELATEDGDQMRSDAGRIVACALRGVSGRERPWAKMLERAQAVGELAEQNRLAELERQIEDLPKGRERSAAKKEGEQAAGQVARRTRTESLDRSLRVAALLMRDLAVAAAGDADMLLARDREQAIVKSTKDRSVGPLLRAAALVDESRSALRRNVSEELALQSLSFRIERELSGAR